MPEDKEFGHLKCKSLHITDNYDNTLITLGISTETNKPLINLTDGHGSHISLFIMPDGTPIINMSDGRTIKVIDSS